MEAYGSSETMNYSTQPECEAPYWSPVDKNEDVMADHYNLTRTYLLHAYMADWILPY